MSIMMEEFKPSVNTLEEVKKLQDLVRKLEIQNFHLRSKQNTIIRKRSISPSKSIKSPTKPVRLSNNQKEDEEKLNIQDSENTSISRKDEYFDNLEIIKLSDIDMSDDESWLYASPKHISRNQSNESPYRWLRKDVDDPENIQLQLTKKALLTKLNELEILSTPRENKSPVRNPVVSNLKKPQVPYKASLLDYDHPHIDTRTFTKSKKKQAKIYLESLEGLETENSLEQNDMSLELRRRGSDLSSDSMSSCHVLEDANDVQEVARMQEESLRLSSPLGTPKRKSLNSVSVRKSSASSKESTSDHDILENTVLCDSHPDTFLNEDVTNGPQYQLHPINHTDNSSSESSFGSNASLHNVGKGKVTKLSGYRRSLPNLNRDMPLSRQPKNKVLTEAKQQKSVPRNANTPSRKSDSNLLSTQKIRREALSPSRQRLKQPFNQMGSPNPSYIGSSRNKLLPSGSQNIQSADSRLRVKSGLPRPARTSSGNRSAIRSGIPGPTMLNKKQVEDSWSEGCF